MEVVIVVLSVLWWKWTRNQYLATKHAYLITLSCCGLNDLLLCNTYDEVISYWLLLNLLNFTSLIHSLEDTRGCHLWYGIFIRSIARGRGLSTLEISLSWLKYVPSSYTDLYEVIGLWPWWIWYEEIYRTDHHGRYWSRYVG